MVLRNQDGVVLHIRSVSKGAKLQLGRQWTDDQDEVKRSDECRVTSVEGNCGAEWRLMSGRPLTPDPRTLTDSVYRRQRSERR